MSKYYKAEDVIRAIDDAFDSIPMKQTTEILQARRTIRSLPTIEVSEDNEPTFEQIKEYCRKRCLTIVTADMFAKITNDVPLVISEDAVSRKAVGEMLMDSWVDGFEYQGDLFRDLAKIPSIIPQPKEGEWIPCSERLPNKYKTVLTTSKDGRVQENFINAGGWSRNTYAVVAWMPLPEPWKGTE